MPQLHPDMIIHQRYQLQRPLGKGGFSIVWLAIDLADRNNAVALKISLPDKDTAGEQPVRMENQHNTTRNLENQHLLRSREFFMVENAGCLVFDYMAGGTLHHLVRKNGGLPEREVAKLIQQLGGALQYLHEHALIHFDIKPENILIDAFGNYYLSDFDTASRLENSMVRVSRIYADTPQYRSPEHIRGAAELSEKVDIFAFGTTIFEVCEGILEKDYGIGTALISGLPKPPLQGNYAMRLENLIHACWNQHPSDRPTADALENYATHRLNKNFWPPIIEFKPDDSSLEDLAGAGSGTTRDTVGRPTVVLPPSAQPSSNSVPKTSFRSSVTRWLIQSIPKKQTGNIKSPIRKWILPVLGIVIVLVSGYFLAGWIMTNHQFSERMNKAEQLKDRNLLKEAYTEVQEAKQLCPEDSTVTKLRREILKMALDQHTVELHLARQVLKSKKYKELTDMIDAIESNKPNASILVGDDSTSYYLGKLKAMKSIHFPTIKKNKTNK